MLLPEKYEIRNGLCVTYNDIVIGSFHNNGVVNYYGYFNTRTTTTHTISNDEAIAWIITMHRLSDEAT